MLFISVPAISAENSSVTMTSITPANGAVLTNLTPTFVANLSDSVNPATVKVDIAQDWIAWSTSRFPDLKGTTTVTNNGKTINYIQTKNLPYFDSLPGNPAGQNVLTITITATDTVGKSFYARSTFKITKQAYENTKSQITFASTSPTANETLTTVTPTFTFNFSQAVNPSGLSVQVNQRYVPWGTGMFPNLLGPISVSNNNKTVTYQQKEPLVFIDGMVGNPTDKNYVDITIGGKDANNKDFVLTLPFLITKQAYANSKSTVAIVSGVNNASDTLTPSITLNLNGAVDDKTIKTVISEDSYIAWSTAIHPEYQGKGYGSEITSWACRYA